MTFPCFPGELVATQEESGAVTGINRLQVTLARQDLDAQWQCRVQSPALTAPLVANLRIDVHGMLMVWIFPNSKLTKPSSKTDTNNPR